MRIRWDLTSCGGPTRWNTLLEEKGVECCGTGRGEDIKPALIGWASEVLLWLRRLERWLEANVFVEVFPVPGSRATPSHLLKNSQKIRHNHKTREKGKQLTFTKTYMTIQILLTGLRLHKVWSWALCILFTHNVQDYF
jgi:hypothetical protein